MDEKWYVESRTKFISAFYDLIMLAMAVTSAVSPIAPPIGDGMAPFYDYDDDDDYDDVNDDDDDDGSLFVRRCRLLNRPIKLRSTLHLRRPIVLDFDVDEEDMFMEGSPSGECEKDLSSPDSNDSGIQADSYGTLQRHLIDTDDNCLYAVVRKPKRQSPETTSAGNQSSSVDADILLDHATDVSESQTKKEFVEKEEESDDVVYAVARKKRTQTADGQDEMNRSVKVLPCLNGKDLPPSDEKIPPLPDGWQRHEDADGPYYWHIKSGTIQREPPPACSIDLPTVHLSTKLEVPKMASVDFKADVKNVELTLTSNNNNTGAIADRNDHRRSAETSRPSATFVVRLVGNLPVSLEDLATDRIGKAISRCIVTLSHQPTSKDLYLRFNGDLLELVDRVSGSLFESQLIKSIRIWGAGNKKDSSDFAYVAHNHSSGQHLCWVFKSETTGHEIASVLRDVCFRILTENGDDATESTTSAKDGRGQTSFGPAAAAANRGISVEFSPGGARSGSNVRFEENNFPKEPERNQRRNQTKEVVFPQPMSESKKVINCHYLGTMRVPKPLGMDVLNDAMEMIYSRVPMMQWVKVMVEVAPSAVTVFQHDNPNGIVFECRIRFLTFLGIAVNNCRLGAFIMNTAQNEFFAHVFHCEPDAGLFCRTIKAACKLRYQKCLDAQQLQKDNKPAATTDERKGIKSTLQKGVQGIFGGMNKKQQLKG